MSNEIGSWSFGVYFNFINYIHLQLKNLLKFELKLTSSSNIDMSGTIRIFVILHKECTRKVAINHCPKKSIKEYFCDF